MKDLINQLISAGIEEPDAKSEIAFLQKEFADQNKIKEIVNERIKSRTPIQYLIGKAYFMDFWVHVTPKVLIPRPETEILVEEAAKGMQNDITAIDIGTGSGVIPIALAKLIPNIKIIAIDIDNEVIKLAKENAKLNKVSEKIGFKACDLFSGDVEEIFKTNNFDLIISNPPYIKENYFLELEPEIYLHEPKIAHCGTKENKTGTIYHERIIELAVKYPPKLLALEIDPPLVNDLKALLKKNNLNNFEIVKDYSKLARCLFIYLNS